MRKLIQRYLSPADRLGEVLFGLIMALGFTGAVRLGRAEADNRELFIGIFGCNLAWAIVDGLMYIMSAMFERGRKARLMREVRAAKTEEAALACIGVEVDQRLELLTTDDEREQIHRWVLEIVRRDDADDAHLRLDDILGGAAVALIILLATLPVIVPFLVVANPDSAVRISNWIALAELFGVGVWWGRVVGARPLRLATGLTLVGAAMVVITILLGG